VRVCSKYVRLGQRRTRIIFRILKFFLLQLSNAELKFVRFFPISFCMDICPPATHWLNMGESNIPAANAAATVTELKDLCG